MSKKILLVDDQDDILEILQIYIEGFFSEIETICANGGHEACTILSEESVDSIICDFRMPEGNGEIVFRCNEDNYKLPFAWHSATFDSDIKNQTDLLAKNTLVLSKPVSEEELIEKLNIMLATTKAETKYRRIRISILRKINTSNVHVFIKLGESKYIPLNNEDEIPQDKLIELETKGEEFLYVYEEEIKRIGKQFLAILEAKIEDAKSIEEVYFVTSEVVNEVNRGFSDLGVDPEALRIAQKCADACLKNLNKDETIRRMMLGKIDRENYISSHSLLTIQFASLMTDDFELMLKLGQVAILHDLSINNERLAKIHNFSEKAFENLMVNEKQLVLNHGIMLAEKINKLVDADVISIIEQHHKYLNEDAWLSNSTALEILFFLSHELAHISSTLDVKVAIDWLRKSEEKFKNIQNKNIYYSILNQFKK